MWQQRLCCACAFWGTALVERREKPGVCGVSPVRAGGDTGRRASAVPGCHRCPFVPAGCLEHAGQQAVLLLQDDVSVGVLRGVLGGIQQGEEREGHAQTPRCHLCATTLRVRP